MKIVPRRFIFRITESHLSNIGHHSAFIKVCACSECKCVCIEQYVCMLVYDVTDLDAYILLYY